MARGWQSVRIDEIDPIPVVGGTLLWRPVRRTLDIGAFGINAYIAPNAGDDVVEEHTEKLYRHEEIYVVLSGRATFTLDDETLDAPAGTVVFIRDPAVKRHARAEEPDTSVLAVGGPRDAAYEPSPWERAFFAEKHRAVGRLRGRRRGDLARARAASRRSGPALRPRLRGGACGSSGGRARACAPRAPARPEFRDHAQKDPDLVSLRDRPDWPL